MRCRLVASLLVASLSRAGWAADADGGPAAAPTAPDAPPADAAPPPVVAPLVVEPSPPAAPPTAPVVLAPPPVVPPLPPMGVVVEPLAPPRAATGVGPLVAGALTMFVPFVVGCGLWSTNDDALERAGTTVMVAGFAAAPWVSHGLARRWKRGAAFGAVSAAFSAATLVAMDAKDPFYAPFANRQRVPFGVFLTGAMFAGAIGVLDSFLTAGEAP
jgi:hypothetical protein